jgi:signal transduction histidine kinase
MLKRMIKSILESGFNKSQDYQMRRVTLLTNSISLILSGVMLVLFLIRTIWFSQYCTPMDFIFGVGLFLVPVILNRYNLHIVSRMFLAVVPIFFIWYMYVIGMKVMPSRTVTVYDGLRIYLLAVSCIPFLVLGRNMRILFIAGVIPSFVSVFFFELIVDAFNLTLSVQPDSDYGLMQVRFMMSYVLIAGSCYVLQRTIHKNDQINMRLLKRLQEKNAIIECQNRELLVSRSHLSEVNRQLEELLEQRARKIYSQRKSILSYAYANSHHVRGPVARLMGLVELYRIDRDLGCDWLMETVDRETTQMDTTIRRLSREMDPLD